MEGRNAIVWRVYVREGDRGADYAEDARRGGYIAFGGRDAGAATKFSSEEEFVRAYTARYGDGAVRAQQIWELRRDSQPDDWVVMPSRKTRRVHIGRMREGGYYFDESDSDVRFAHRWPVEWLGDITYDRAREAIGGAVLAPRALRRLEISPQVVAALVNVAVPSADEDAWVVRSRATARLVRQAYDHATTSGRLSARTLYALCQLMWFTRGQGDVRDPYGGIVARTYWRKTKLPGLIGAFGLPESTRSLDAAASELAARGVGIESSLVTGSTGFVFAYPAYRNITSIWIEKHASAVLSLAAQARVLETDEAGSRLALGVERLPRVPRPDGKASIPAASILTPVLACLDPRSRFPLLNGSDRVRATLRALGVAGASLADQHDHLVALIERSNPRRCDAFALDQYGVGSGTSPAPRRASPRSQPLARKPTDGRSLSVKDASDIEAVVRGGRRAVRRLHNDMTNALETLCRGRLVAQEGVAADCMYDALIANYDGRGRDLLIEVKSSTERGVLRLAVGQLLDYRRGLTRRDSTDLALLVPVQPDEDAVAFLRTVGVRTLWFTDTTLRAVTGAWSLELPAL